MVQGELLHTVNDPKIAGKSGKIGAQCSLLVMVLDNVVRVQGRLPNMVIYTKMARKSAKKDTNGSHSCC